MALLLQVWNPNELADTSRDSLNHKHKLTPYQDMKLKGKVVATYADGQQVSSISLSQCLCFIWMAAISLTRYLWDQSAASSSSFHCMMFYV